MNAKEKIQEIRVNWAIADKKRDEGLSTPSEIRRFDDIHYGPYGVDNLLDIYVNKNVSEIQPSIVNIHGGNWVYGNKEVYQYYCMNLALKGFTVININYRLAPENKFPAPLEDINRVMEFIEKSGNEYYVDKDNLIMVGDSAGAQLVSHYAAVLTNKPFSKLFSFKVPNIKVNALGLNCGIYDGISVIENSKDLLFNEYLGIGNKTPSEKIMKMIDTIGNITSSFPPSFIMSSKSDFLLPEAEPMFRILQKHGVPSVLKIYGKENSTETGHVFHINCRLEEADKCNSDECEFFRKYTV